MKKANLTEDEAIVSDAVIRPIEQARGISASERAMVAEQHLLGLDRPDPAIDAIWAAEAESRLAAYLSGSVLTVRLSDVLRK